MRNSPKKIKKRSPQNRASKKGSSRKRSSKKRTIQETPSNEVPLKDRSLGEKILIGICIFILTGFPFIVIVLAITALIFVKVEDIKHEKEYRLEIGKSNEDLYGKYLYLDKIGEDVYEVVSEDEDPERRLEWDEEFRGYYDDLSDAYVWYDEKREKWQYWFNGISSDYKDYGWMVYKPEGWRIQRDRVDWIKLPEKYDRSKLWYIKQTE